MKEEAVSDVTSHVADAVQQLRLSKGLSLDGLAAKSGVSRSMISLIERAESSPTAVVLDKIARALGVTLTALFQQAATEPDGVAGPVSRAKDRTPWRDPESGYVRCNISPVGVPQPMQVVEVRFPAGGRVTFENGARGARVYQQIWVLAGTIDITIDRERHRLLTGDCLAMELDRPTILHNPTRKETRYALIIATEGISKR